MKHNIYYETFEVVYFSNVLEYLDFNRLALGIYERCKIGLPTEKSQTWSRSDKGLPRIS
jgi:hypothetical protein